MSYFLIEEDKLVTIRADTGATVEITNYSARQIIKETDWSYNGRYLAVLVDNQLLVYEAPLTVATIKNSIAACVSQQGILTSLTAKINAEQWRAFINEVEAQRGKKISEECAVDLISMAQYLLENE